MKIKSRLSPAVQELVVDTFSAALFCTGTGMILLYLRGYAAALGQIGWMTLLLCIMIALVSRRWWLAPLAVGTLGLLFGLLLWQATEDSLILVSLQHLASGLTGFFRLGQEAPPPDFLLSLALILPLATVFFILVRLVDRLRVYLAITLTLLVVVLGWIPAPVGLYALLIAVAGLLIQLPRSFVRLLKIERPQDSSLPRAPMQLLAIPVVAVTLLLANQLVPDRPLNWRLPVLANWVSDIEDLWTNHFGPGQGWPAFNLVYYGFENTSNQLGGPANPSDELILRIITTRPLLLKGSTRTIYTGSSWQREVQPIYRFDSPLWRRERKQAFSDALSNSPAGQAFNRNWRQTIELDIEQIGQQATLFQAGLVRKIKIPDRSMHMPYFTPDGDLFAVEAVTIYDKYTLTVSYPDRSRNGFDPAITELERSLEAGQDEHWLAIQASNLQLPDELPVIVRETARQATSSGSTAYQRAVLLETYLRELGTYSLETIPPPEGKDFVADFLETRRGYCVHYASAMVVMARTLGIPARFVEGVIVQPKPGSAVCLVSGKSAHAWAELYFEGIGWMAFDATPAAPVNGTGNPVTDQDQPSNPLLPDPDGRPNGADQTQPGSSQGWWLSFIILLVILLILRFLLTLARWRHHRTFNPEVVRKHHPDITDQLNYYYQDFLRQLDCLDLQPGPGETLLQFAQRAEDYCRLPGRPVPEALWPVIRWRYGEVTPTSDDVQALASLRQDLEDRLRTNLTATRYLTQRVIRFRF